MNSDKGKSASNKKFHIEFDSKAFDKEIQRSKLSASVETYDKRIAEMNRMVEALDRYDDFAALKLDSSKYEKDSDADSYGIEEVFAIHHGGGVILRHQKEAALAFIKELRGFGLLADVVGSGKTFEAGVVLSELAVRGKVKSLLIVVPEQVYPSWVDVMEMKFGLGKGVLRHVGKDFDLTADELESAGGERQFSRPVRPLIVTMEDFAEWPESVAKLLFDVIVVDEAHNLCVEEGQYAKAMKLLSLMMVTKKQANMTYCLLLSATPHSGNLEKMFRLWYFVRCKGGNPSDFNEIDDSRRSADYRKEKAYYMTHVCRGASTVMEFIKKVKIFEVVNNYAAQFGEYLKKTGDAEAFSSMTEGEKFYVVCGFLSQNPSVEDKVNSKVAAAYHNGVLRSIMIRQPNAAVGKKKNVENVFFFPTRKKIGEVKVTGADGAEVTVDCAAAPDGKCVVRKTKALTLKEYLDETRGERGFTSAYAEFLVSKVLGTIGFDDEIFTKKDSLKYYWQQFACFAPEIRTEIRVIPCGEEEMFAAKLAKTKEILRAHVNERILVFFDYELKKEKVQFDRFEQALSADPEFASRVITGTKQNKGKADKEFGEKSDAILIVKDSAFTEGVNLQESNIIINFQITPDPLAMDQRIGRIFRLGQKNDVTIYSLADMSALEGYVLAYFSRIGLMSSNSGDATIIAGSNNERMVAVRCKVCKSVKLYSQEDYEAKKRTGGLYCRNTELCRKDDPKGTLMEEISVYDFKCDTCTAVFSRSVADEGYTCMSVNNSRNGIMCNSGEYGDRHMYCRKICALDHCSRFLEGDMKGKCAALTYYRKNRNATDSDLMLICLKCKNRRKCPPECRIDSGEHAIAACTGCEFAECSPKPQSFVFDEKWEIRCPVCHKGRIKPVVARTFAAYIRAAWDFAHDNGAGFCRNLEAEARKVSEIKTILDMDNN